MFILVCLEEKQHNNKIEKEKEKKFSPAGNRTPVSRVTGGDTHHYTTEEELGIQCKFTIIKYCFLKGLEYEMFFLEVNH